MIYHSKVCVLSGRRLKTALQGPIGTPLGFCLFGRSQKFNLVASWVIAQKNLIGIAKDLRKKNLQLIVQAFPASVAAAASLYESTL